MSSELWYVRDRNRVTGPFNREQLEALRRRGQLARFHQVSRDRQSWVSAATLSDLFSAPVQAGSNEVVPLTFAPEPAHSWFYATGSIPTGPVSVEDLRRLLQSGMINTDTMVWREGLPSWITFRESGLDQGSSSISATTASKETVLRQPARHSPRRRGLLLITSMVVTLILGSIGMFFYFRGDVKRSGVRDWPGSTVRHPIHSVTEAPELTAAVGLVICGAVVTEFDGTQTEFPFSTGTCFVISEKGVLLTNRHVVQDIAKLAKADKLRSELEDKKKIKLEPKIWVFFKNQKYEATIRHQSDVFDLAILKIEPRQPLPYFRLAAKDDVARGTPVLALGFPGASRLPLSQEEEVEQVTREQKKGVRIDHHFQKSNFDYVITNGIVSVIRHEGTALCIEHTARLSGGNSGGPLVKDDGTVIGMNTLMAKEDVLAVPIYLALGVAQFHEELEREVPELAEP